MNNRVKSIFGSMLVLVSTTVNGGLGFIPEPSVAYAEEVTEESNNSDTEITLNDGTYIVPFYQQLAVGGTMVNNTNTHFYGQAILNVNGDENTVTFAVENWSKYSAFVPMKQERTAVYSSWDGTDEPTILTYDEDHNPIESPLLNYRWSFIYPDKLNSLASENDIELIGWDTFISNNPIENGANAFIAASPYEDNFFDFALEDYVNKKFGNIEIVSYDSNMDTAYVSFKIDDYNEYIEIAGWSNTPSAKVQEATKYNSYYEPINIKLNLDEGQYQTLDNLLETSNDNSSIGYRLRAWGGFTGSGIQKPLYANLVNYESNDLVNSYFEEAAIDSDEGIYLLTVNVTDPDGFVYEIPTKKEEKENVWSKAWSLFFNSELEELTVNNSKITIPFTYNDLQFGKYLFMTDKNTAKTMCVCICPFSDLAEEFVIADEMNQTGITVKTNTSVLPKTTKLNIDVNDQSIPAVKKWIDCPFYEDVKAFTINYINNGSQIKENGSTLFSLPLPDDFNLEDYFLIVQFQHFYQQFFF